MLRQILARALASKTLWAAFLTFLISVATWLAGDELIKQHPALVSIAGVLLSVLMVGLRFVTKTPLVPGPDVPVVPVPAPVGPETPLQARIAWVIDGVTDVLRGVAPPKETRELGLKTVNELFDLAEKERADKAPKKSEPAKVDAAGNLIGA